MGHELEGVPASILDLSDVVVQIPMLGEKESLNVAVAFGAAGYIINSKVKIQKSKVGV